MGGPISKSLEAYVCELETRFEESSSEKQAIEVHVARLQDLRSVAATVNTQRQEQIGTLQLEVKQLSQLLAAAQHVRIQNSRHCMRTT